MSLNDIEIYNYCYNNIELVTETSSNLLRFKFHNNEIRIRKLDTRRGNYGTYKVKDLTELKNEIKNRIK